MTVQDRIFLTFFVLPMLTMLAACWGILWLIR